MAEGIADRGCDAFITSDPLILEHFPPQASLGSNPMTASDAVALLGLFLRVREDFTIDLFDIGRYRIDRSLFYWVMLRDLTPSAWRWFSACVAHSTHTRDDTVLLTAQTALERIDRAFRARDRMHERLQLPSTRDNATEAIFFFDVVLFMLGGVFDVLAKVAHAVHQLSGNERSAGWGGRNWMRTLNIANPALATMMAWGQPHRDARELVATLRNTIHQEALRTITWRERGSQKERVIVPAAIESDLEDVLGRVGTPESFGVSREQLDNRLYIDPGVYIERILPKVFDALNAIMDATPVENLTGVDPTALPTGPPTGDETFDGPTRDRIRLLGGVGYGSPSTGSLGSWRTWDRTRFDAQTACTTTASFPAALQVKGRICRMGRIHSPRLHFTLRVDEVWTSTHR